MAGIKISALPAVPSAAFTDILPTVQTGVTYKVTNTQLATLFGFSGSGILAPSSGGTGVNNSTHSLTLGGSVTFNGAFTVTQTYTGATNVTFPTSGTLATTSQIPSLPLSLANGGTSASLTANNGGIFYSNATTGAILAGTATANQVLLSGASAAPAWSTATYPATTTINQILYSSSANTVAGLATANSAMLVTGSTGVPVMSGTMTNGQVVIGSTGATPVIGTLTAGTNISVTNAAGSITIAATGAGGFIWNDQTSSSVAMVVNNGYVTDNGASLVTYTLPTTAVVGSVLEISGFSSGGWKIAQNASQLIHLGSSVTTTGTGGSLASTNAFDSIKLVNVVANTTWVVQYLVGNLTVV